MATPTYQKGVFACNITLLTGVINHGALAEASIANMLSFIAQAACDEFRISRAGHLGVVAVVATRTAMDNLGRVVFSAVIHGLVSVGAFPGVDACATRVLKASALRMSTLCQSFVGLVLLRASRASDLLH